MHAIAVTVHDYVFYSISKDNDRTKYEEALKRQSMKTSFHIVK